jgi:hypothetical protein
MSGFGGLFRAGAQLERSEAMELATVPKDGKRKFIVLSFLLCMSLIFSLTQICGKISQNFYLGCE